MNYFLIAAAVGNGFAVLLHIGCIYFGAAWYRFFGAGEQMALWADQGSLRPTIITSFIIVILSVFTLYSLSGSQAIKRLPLLRTILCGITSILLIRGLGGFFMMSQITEQGAVFWFWSSIICLILGVLHLIGTIQIWSNN